jgi:mannose-6-phosphate isomerase-like protein (cupin superfamily)
LKIEKCKLNPVEVEISYQTGFADCNRRHPPLPLLPFNFLFSFLPTAAAESNSPGSKRTRFICFSAIKNYELKFVIAASDHMTPIEGYHLIKPDDLTWRPSNLMKVPNADYLERTGSELLGARLWRLPAWSANTLHKHIQSEEFYFVLEGEGRMRVGKETLTVPRYGGVLVGPGMLRQIFNDSDTETLWLIVGGPEREFEPGAKPDMSLYYPEDPKQLPPELKGAQWPR